MARTGSQWAALPRQFGTNSTVHLRFTERTASGELERAWAVLLREYDGEIGLDWEWQVAGGGIVKDPFGKKGELVRRRPQAPTSPTAPNLALNAIP